MSQHIEVNAIHSPLISDQLLSRDNKLSIRSDWKGKTPVDEMISYHSEDWKCQFSIWGDLLIVNRLEPNQTLNWKFKLPFRHHLSVVTAETKFSFVYSKEDDAHYVIMSNESTPVIQSLPISISGGIAYPYESTQVAESIDFHLESRDDGIYVIRDSGTGGYRVIVPATMQWVHTNQDSVKVPTSDYSLLIKILYNEKVDEYTGVSYYSSSAVYDLSTV